MPSRCVPTGHLVGQLGVDEGQRGPGSFGYQFPTDSRRYFAVDDPRVGETRVRVELSDLACDGVLVIELDLDGAAGRAAWPST